MTRTIYVIQNKESGLFYSGGRFDGHSGSFASDGWKEFKKARLFNMKNHAAPKMRWLSSVGVDVALVSCQLTIGELEEVSK